MTTNTIDNDVLTWILFHHSYSLEWPDPFIVGRLSIGGYKCQLKARMGGARLTQLELIGYMAPFARKL